MMWGYYDGWNMVWMGTIMILFLGGAVAVIAYAVRAFTSGKAGDPATDTLRMRLASGEISQEDFDKTRKAIQR